MLIILLSTFPVAYFMQMSTGAPRVKLITVFWCSHGQINMRKLAVYHDSLSICKITYNVIITQSNGIEYGKVGMTLIVTGI